MNQSSISNAQVKCAVGEEGRLSFRNAVAVLAIVFCLHSNNSAAVTDDNIPFKIPQQRADTALTLFAEQANLTLVFPFDQVKDITANRLVGNYPIDTAINILLQDTGLMPTFSNQLVLNIAIDDKGKSMNKNTRKTLLASMVGLFAAGGLSTAAAQEAESARAQGVLDEIIVTATKRQTTLQETAMSISAVSGQDIAERGLVSMGDYLSTIPGVTVQDQGVGANAIIIRGISIDPDFEGFSTGQTTGVYLGDRSLTGLLQGGSGSSDLKMVDLERVEVLRGPQGTLFGAGALGGAVRNIPNAPNLDELSGSISIGYSNTSGQGDSNTVTQGVINIPLIEDKLALRAVAYHFDNSGYMRNIAASDPTSAADAVTWGATVIDRSDVGSNEYTGGRVSLLWKPNDRATVSLMHAIQKLEEDGLPQDETALGKFVQTRPQIRICSTCDASSNEFAEDDVSITTLEVGYEWDSVNLVSISSWVEDDFVMARDIGFFFGGLPFSQNGKYDVSSFSQEIRLVSSLDGPLQYIAGIYYEDVDRRRLVNNFFGGDPALNTFGAGAGTVEASFFDVKRPITQKAVFGEVSYDVTDELKITAGTRVFEFEKGIEDRVNFFNGSGESGQTIGSEKDDSTYKLSVDYTPSDDVLVYAAWTEGFRLGNPIAASRFPSECDADNDGNYDGSNGVPITAFLLDPDTTSNTELGTKLSFLDRRLQVNAAIFKTEWSSIPIRVAFSPNCSTTANAGEAEVTGVEFEATYSITDDFLVSMGYANLSAELVEDAPGVNGADGDRLPGSAETSLSLSFRYEFTLGSYPSYARADYSSLGEFYNDLKQAGRELGSYDTLNIRAGIEIDQFSIELFGNNITDSDEATFDAGFPDGRGNRLRPRTVGVNVGYQF